jgi:two-component system, LytTR family, sensor kinase
MFQLRFLISILTGWTIWILVHIIYLLQNNVPADIAFADASIFATVLAFAAWSLLITLKYYKPDSRKIIEMLGWSSILSWAVLQIHQVVIKLIIPIEYRILEQSSNGKLVLAIATFLVLTIIILVNWIVQNNTERKETFKRNEQAEKLKKEAELLNLRLQLQPHFLFNSLNSINALIPYNPAEAQKMLQLLSEFLRGTIRKDNDALIDFEEEIKHLNLYLNIEKVRFDHRLNIELNIDETTKNCKIPPLILQPLVENAIKFGIYGTLGAVTINIHAQLNGNNLKIEIKNPFDKNDKSAFTGTGFGLDAVKKRLQLIYGSINLIHTSEQEEIFTVQLLIPQSK